MRRSRQQLPSEAAVGVLEKGTNGVLSLIDSDGEPYGVPVSYVFDRDGYIYFHSAIQGHKIDCIRAEPRCSFCVVDQDHIVPGEFTTYFRSVIASGCVEIISDTEGILKGLRLLCGKYSPGIDPSAEIERCLGHVSILRMKILEISGKEAIELIRASE